MNKKRLILVIVVAVFVILAVISSGMQQKDGRISVPTTYDNGANGYRAFYLLLSKLGHKVTRFEEGDGDRESIPRGVLIIARPFSEYLDNKKAEKIYDWAADGGSLVIAAAGKTPFWTMLAVNSRERGKLLSSISPETDSPLSQGVKKVFVRGNWRFTLPPQESHPFNVHLKDRDGVILASTRVGKGRIFILSAPELFDNEEIQKEDNAVLMANLARQAGNDRIIIFDESIHGFFRDGSRFAFSPVQQVILFQLALAAFLFYGVFLNRFGFPRPWGEDPQRSSIEYVHSLAGLFQRSRANRYALENIYRGFKEKLGRAVGARYNLEEAHLVERLGQQNQALAGGAEKLMKKVRQAISSKDLNRENLISLTGEMDTLLEKTKQPDGGGKIE